MESIKKLENHIDQLTLWLRSFQGSKIPTSLKGRIRTILEKIINADDMSDDEWKVLAPKPQPPIAPTDKVKKKKEKKKGKKKQKKKSPKKGLYTDKKYYNEAKEEKLLDGSPNSYQSREKGKYGSPPVHDNYNEESKP